MQSHDDTQPIRGFIVPLSDSGMLLPNAAVAEIVDLSAVDPLDAAPAWLPGMFNWRGIIIPVFSIEHAMGVEVPAAKDNRTRLLVINSLGATDKLKRFALVSRGIPKLITLDRGDIDAQEQILKSPVVRAYATIGNEDVFIPDLDRIETMLAGALVNAA